ncbi:ADP-ribosylhydrolase ARH3 [Halyomorpha halys]|uniref:ADP-ribosylhydrolase ARH3 n=1 Tax=Halyomorpha halys TaxID=286706 RepID=UPI0006D5014D|nr:poly(ADP-ribose) glycohydrolase ARH3 [Halyomorpha halys]
MSGLMMRGLVEVNKFKGALVGALLGDCLGGPFEGVDEPSTDTLQEYFDNMENPSYTAPVKRFTDDTAMTLGILKSFVELGCFDARDIANRFVTNYFQEPNRGYGESVVTVFKKLHQILNSSNKSNSETDFWKPAQQQFDGSGSLGNGGAMRIAPVALYCYSDYKLLLTTAEKCTKLTHTHKLGVNGALLQALAVQQSLMLDPSQPLDVDCFITELMVKMTEIEKADGNGEDTKIDMPYVEQLKLVQNLLTVGDINDEEVIDLLGNSIRAQYSVPTALFCFLRAQRPILSVQTENKFRRTLQYCISLGGDTDTIASMAGAISGAYYGLEYINENLRSHCEGVEEIVRLAEQLYSIAPSPPEHQT